MTCLWGPPHTICLGTPYLHCLKGKTCGFIYKLWVNITIYEKKKTEGGKQERKKEGSKERVRLKERNKERMCETERKIEKKTESKKRKNERKKSR